MKLKTLQKDCLALLCSLLYTLAPKYKSARVMYCQVPFIYVAQYAIQPNAPAIAELVPPVVNYKQNTRGAVV